MKREKTSLMKKFQFSLQRLLQFHQQRQKQAELKLRQAAMERAAAAAEVERIRQQITEACELPEVVGGVIDPDSRVNSARLIEFLTRTLTVAQEKLKGADQRFREVREECTKVTQSVEAFLHLRSQQRIEHRDETNRQQQIELDEVVMRRWSGNGLDELALPIGSDP